MSRPLRIEYEGAWYHVMNRGANKRTIFHCRQHYEIFLKLLNEIHNRYQVEIHAYCLMSNHYHLLIHTRLANLSRALRHLDGVYTQRYNRSQQTDGPLFRGRFKSIVVDSEKYLLQLSRYIHLNPVVGKLAAKPECYQWSSYAYYMKPATRPYWLTVTEVLGKFGAALDSYNYNIFVLEGIDQELATFFSKAKQLSILGSKIFVKQIREKYLQVRRPEPEIPEQSQVGKLFELERIMQIVANYYHLEIADLKTVKRKPGNFPRQIAIYLACELSGQKFRAIADNFTNISYSGVAKTYQRIKNRVDKDEDLKQIVYKMDKALMSFVKT